MERNIVDQQGLCGIAKAASYPIKKHDNPENLPEICGWYVCTADPLNSWPVQSSCAVYVLVMSAFDTNKKMQMRSCTLAQ